MDSLTSLKNPKVMAWRSLKERKGRKETDCFLVEGRKMVEEARLRLLRGNPAVQ